MKNLFRFLFLTVFAVGSIGLNSCDKGNEPDQPTPPVIIPPAELENQYRFDDQTTDIKSLVVDDMINEDMYTIILSPVAGLTNYEDATKMNGSAYANEIFLLSIPAAEILNGSVTIDVMNTDVDFMFENHTKTATSLTEIAMGMTDGITAGSIKIIDENEETMTIEFSFTLTDGRILEAQYKGKYMLPELPAEPTSYIEYNDEKIEIKSIIVDDMTFPGKAYVLMSEEAGLTTYEEFTAKENDAFIHKFSMVALGCYDIADIMIDVKNSTEYYRFVNALGILPEVEEVTNSDNATVSAGNITAKVADGKLTLDLFFMPLDSGQPFTIHGETPYTALVPPTSDYLELDGERLAINTALYEIQYATEEDNNFYNNIYLTPAKIEGSGKFPAATDYYIKFKSGPDNNIGETLDFITDAWYFEVTLCIPETGEEYVFSDEKQNGATGSYFIEAGAGMSKPTKVEFEFNVSGHTIKGSYTGDFVRTWQPNTYKFGSAGNIEEGEWKSAVVDKRDPDMNILYLSTTAGITTIEGMADANPMIVYMSAAKSNGRKCAMSPGTCWFEYQGVKKDSYQNGNMIFSVESKSSSSSIYFRSSAQAMSDAGVVAFQGYYGGDFTVVK